jgi:uncharacterized PurR-regulated membrane protein YhhQ (DUF165 family)
LAIVWVGLVVLSNFTADWFVSIGPLRFSVATLIFGATFTLRDFLHCRGRRFVYVTIVLAAVANVVAALVVGVSLRIILASFFCILLAESADTEVFARIRAEEWWVRALGSNVVSIPLDTVLFVMLAFAGVLSNDLLLSLIVGETVVKYVVALVLVWLHH